MRLASVLVAAMVLTFVGCDGAPSTPLSEGTPLPPNTVAVVAGYPITQWEFLESRRFTADSVALAEQRLSGDEGTGLDRELLEASERYGVGSMALEWLIVDYALLAAAVSAGHEISEEELRAIALSRGVTVGDEAGQEAKEKTDQLKREYLRARFLAAELKWVAREEGTSKTRGVTQARNGVQDNARCGHCCRGGDNG